jgi:hypothetical protein
VDFSEQKGGKAKRLHRNITMDFVLRDVFPTRERAEQGCLLLNTIQW